MRLYRTTFDDSEVQVRVRFFVAFSIRPKKERSFQLQGIINIRKSSCEVSSFVNNPVVYIQANTMIYQTQLDSKRRYTTLLVQLGDLVAPLVTQRIEFILEGNSKNLSVGIFSVPFSLKGSSKCTNHVNVHKLFAVEYINDRFTLFLVNSTLTYILFSLTEDQNMYIFIQ